MRDDARNSTQVDVSQLRYRCPPKQFDFESTGELSGQFEIIGQERAIRAIRLGLSVPSRGYNILVQGLTGTGKETTVKSILEQVADDQRIPMDICYVYNFDDPDAPQVLYLAPGKGDGLRRDMDDLVDYLDRTVPAVLESDEFKERRAQIIETEGEKGRAVIKEFEERIKKENFVLVELRYGPMKKTEIAPIVKDKPRAGEELEQMLGEGEISREEYERIDKIRDAFSEELDGVLKHARESELQVSAALRALVFGFGAEIINPLIDDLKAKNTDEKTGRYLERVRFHVQENLESFIKKEGESPPVAVLRAGGAGQDRFHAYRVNLLVDNSKTTRVPIIVETHPTYKNLFGTIERNFDRSGQSFTDFSRIKAGSLLRAVGGYIVLSLIEVMSEPGVYQSLKRTLKSGRVDIQGFDPSYLFNSTALKPEPIDVEVKVLLIGDAQSYQLLYNLDSDFRKVFKVKADFDTVMPRNAESEQKYANFVAQMVRREQLLHFDRGAVAAIVEEGVRLAGRKSKLSTQFSDVADLLRESSYWAGQDDSPLVTARHVDQSIEERSQRRNLVENRISEMIQEGVLMISTDGASVGQVNGLSVYDLGDHRFGKPTRITANVATGRHGIINIERESDMSGRSHNKGMLILAGYFRSRFAARRPASLSASIAFEQSYSGVDGDSASSTELYALLSALSETPLRQDIAVTGSVNQKGQIQAIGGVNEKIEGFFDTCVAAGISGTQGVLIPRANVDDLMLRKDVVAEIEKGAFQIYAIQSIEEGIELLTGVDAGVANSDGAYPEDTVYGRVAARLEQMSRDLRHAARGTSDKIDKVEADAEKEKEDDDEEEARPEDD